MVIADNLQGMCPKRKLVLEQKWIQARVQLQQAIAQLPRFGNRRLKVLALAVTVPLFGIMTAYAVTEPPQPEQPEFKKVVEQLAAPKVSAPVISGSYWREEFVDVGENFSSFLNRLGVNDNSIQNLLKQSAISKDLLKFKAGQNISVRVDGSGELSAIQFFNDDEDGERNLIALERKDGQWVGSSSAVDTETLPTLRAVTIRTSARGALAQAGVPVEVREAVSEVFNSQFDLNDLHEGDSIRLLYESHYFRGQAIATGNIQAIEVIKDGRQYQAFYYDHGDNTGAYYDANGKALNKGFSQQPVSATRVSSGFGTRFHPILQTWKMHTGIDYAAPSGTPIVAPSDGVVAEVGSKGGYGNTVVLRHRNSLETLYAHMSAFASGVRPGDSVRAGQVIGYVGSTGRSTGPHLHYEVRVNGQPVDPATVALPARSLSRTELAAFKADKQKTDATLARVRGLAVTVAQLD